MTRKEFEALLAIDNKRLNIFMFKEEMWVGDVIDKTTGKHITSFIGDSEKQLILSLSNYYYANC